MGIATNYSKEINIFLSFKKKTKSVIDIITNDEIFVLAGACSFYSFLSIVPFLSAFIGIYLLISDDFSIEKIEILNILLPSKVHEILNSIVESITHNSAILSIGTLVSFIFSLWLANNLTHSLSIALRTIFGLKKSREGILGQIQSLFYTLLLILSLIIFVLAVTIVPILLNYLNLGFFNLFLIYVSRWIIAALYMIVLMSLLYRYLPQHPKERELKNFFPGAILATLLGGAVAVLFSIYVMNFGKYNQVYGALSSIVVFLIWLRLSFTALFLGAYFNRHLLKRKKNGKYYNVFEKINDFIKVHPVSSVLSIVLILIILFSSSVSSVLQKELNSRIAKSPYRGRVDNIGISLLKGEIYIEKIYLEDRKGLLPNLVIDHLRLNLSWLSILFGNIKINLFVENGAIELSRLNFSGRFLTNILDVINLPHNILISTLEIKNCLMSLNQKSGSNIKLGKVKLLGKNISNHITETSPFFIEINGGFAGGKAELRTFLSVLNILNNHNEIYGEFKLDNVDMKLLKKVFPNSNLIDPLLSDFKLTFYGKNNKLKADLQLNDKTATSYKGFYQFNSENLSINLKNIFQAILNSLQNDKVNLSE